MKLKPGCTRQFKSPVLNVWDNKLNVYYIYIQQYFRYIMAVSFIGGGTGVPGKNHWSAASHWQTLSHNVVSSTPRHEAGFELTTLVVIGTDYIGSCKSN